MSNKEENTWWNRRPDRTVWPGLRLNKSKVAPRPPSTPHPSTLKVAPPPPLRLKPMPKQDPFGKYWKSNSGTPPPPPYSTPVIRQLPSEGSPPVPSVFSKLTNALGDSAAEQ
ncbi:MAG: hypothetical protein EBU66_19505, partial [Bacteroidetes bacterium]|nr:hypothetical protein [Bacteroidota bacterium]